LSHTGINLLQDETVCIIDYYRPKCQLWRDILKVYRTLYS